MAFKVDDQAYVARSILGVAENDLSPFYRTTVREKQRRSVKVDMPDGTPSEWIAASKLTRRFGVLIIRIGDFNEDGLLAPLAKSVMHYCRMLLPGDSVRLVELRTEGELIRLWNDYHGMCHQVVLIGHACPQGFQFGDMTILPNRLAEIFAEPAPPPKEFISLGCKTGYADFGKAFSSSPCVSHLLAPFHSVHGCVASLFAKTFLHERLLGNFSPKIAFNHARANLMGAANFRLWVNGQLKGGPA